MTLILFLAILSVLILVHELGHFLVAKRNGILVEEFGFGIPPRIWSKKIGETVYSVNLLPIGGFVKLFGEEGGELAVVSRQKSEFSGKAFFEKSILARLKVILAGVTMNYLLAILAFAIIFTITGIPVKTGKIKVVGIAKDSPAEIGQLKLDDEIVSLDNEKIKDINSFVNLTKEKAGEVVWLEVRREKDNPCVEDKILGGGVGPGFQVSCKEGNFLVAVIPRAEPPEGQGPLGIAISEIEMRHYSFWLTPILGVREGFKESIAWGRMISSALLKMLGQLIFKGEIPKDVVGPIGIYQATGIVAKSGFLALMEFLGILSVNLAIINVLPFPVLDGGRLLFLGIETFFGKKIAPKVEAWVNNLGMALLLLLVLLITINDIVRIITVGNLLEKIKTIF